MRAVGARDCFILRPEVYVGSQWQFYCGAAAQILETNTTN